MACSAGATDDYRDSHQDIDKPKSYDPEFEISGTTKHLFWQMEKALLVKVMESLGSPATSLLDFACGTGRVLGFLENRFERSVGLDISESMASWARANRVKTSEILVGDLTRKKLLGDEQFDVITSFRFFLNAQDSLRREVLHSLLPHLAPSGVLVVNFHLNPWSLTGMFFRVLACVKPSQRIMLSMGDVRRLLDETGYRVERVWGYGHLLHYRDDVIAAPLQGSIEGWLRRLLPTGLAQNFLVVARRK